MKNKLKKEHVLKHHLIGLGKYHNSTFHSPIKSKKINKIKILFLVKKADSNQ